MYHVFILARIGISILLIVANFLPWVHLDDAVNVSNGFDLAVYGFTGADNVLFMKQNVIMAIGTFIIPIVIIIVSAHVAIKSVIDIIQSNERTLISSVVDFSKIAIPAILFMYLVNPFIDDNAGSIYMFAIPQIGLLTVICASFFLPAIAVIEDYLFNDIAEPNSDDSDT